MKPPPTAKQKLSADVKPEELFTRLNILNVDKSSS